ncbi:hypothetical protein E4U55_001755 [Claviceps digitariae]|nr:hypothetical protein E4U55_001755 [Claviceps digitariae]
MVPRLSTGYFDKFLWSGFLDYIKEEYKDDPLVEFNPNHILFKVGDHPILPVEGHKFLRFSSKVSGDTAAEVYVCKVSIIAKLAFGSRVSFELSRRERFGFYDRDEVQESVRSYEQPDETEDLCRLFRFLYSIEPVLVLGIPLYNITDVPGKGRGLTARFKIPKGTRILVEKPLVMVPAVQPPSGPTLEWQIANQLRQLSKAKVKRFLSLHNNFRGARVHPFIGIVKTNALPCGPGSLTGAVYPTLCLVNHSCRPNCHHSWNSELQHEAIHAIRDIAAGEEITIGYLQNGSHQERAKSLKDSFGFDCTCEICALPAADLQASDDRRAKVEELDRAIGNPLRMMNQPSDSLGACHSLLQLLDAEYPGFATALHARMYYDAFQICISHGDQARASIFAEKSYKIRVLCQGKESPETNSVRFLALNPARHPSFEVCSRRWKTRVDMVKTGVRPEHFERWLWRL